MGSHVEHLVGQSMKFLLYKWSRIEVGGGFEPPRLSHPAVFKTVAHTDVRPTRWWRWRDSNSQPLPCKGSTLPIELHPLNTVQNYLVWQFDIDRQSAIRVRIPLYLLLSFLL